MKELLHTDSYNVKLEKSAQKIELENRNGELSYLGRFNDICNNHLNVLKRFASTTLAFSMSSSLGLFPTTPLVWLCRPWIQRPSNGLSYFSGVQSSNPREAEPPPTKQSELQTLGIDKGSYGKFNLNTTPGAIQTPLMCRSLQSRNLNQKRT